MRLIEFCYKSQKFNKAWTYLQQYKIMYPHLMYKIINYEIKILKKEAAYRLPRYVEGDFKNDAEGNN